MTKFVTSIYTIPVLEGLVMKKIAIALCKMQTAPDYFINTTIKAYWISVGFFSYKRTYVAQVPYLGYW